MLINCLKQSRIKDYANLTDEEYIEAIKEESLIKLGYFLRPNELFSEISRKGNAGIEEERISSSKTCKEFLIILNKALWARKAKTISINFSKIWT